MAEAQFYLANCLFDQNLPDSAYVSYVAVLALPAGDFSEAAALGAAAGGAVCPSPPLKSLDILGHPWKSAMSRGCPRDVKGSLKK